LKRAPLAKLSTLVKADFEKQPLSAQDYAAELERQFLVHVQLPVQQYRQTGERHRLRRYRDEVRADFKYHYMRVKLSALPSKPMSESKNISNAHHQLQIVGNEFKNISKALS
jgi:hypothetical protein